MEGRGEMTDAGVVDAIRRLEESVGRRSPPLLAETDLEAVRALALAVMAGAARDRGAGEDAFLRGGALKADRVPGIMSRCRLHDSDTLTLRLHLFEDPILDHYVHNHKTPFASVCLHGGYANLEYEVRDAGDARHHYRYRWLGSGAMSRPEKLPGDLVVARRSAHRLLDSYYMESSGLHRLEADDSAEAEGEHKASSPCLTLYVKARAEDSLPLTLSNDAASLDSESEAWRALDLAARTELFAEMERLLRASFHLIGSPTEHRIDSA